MLFDSFRELCLGFQRGEWDAEMFYDLSVGMLGSPAALLKVAAFVPDAASWPSAAASTAPAASAAVPAAPTITPATFAALTRPPPPSLHLPAPSPPWAPVLSDGGSAASSPPQDPPQGEKRRGRGRGGATSTASANNTTVYYSTTATATDTDAASAAAAATTTFAAATTTTWASTLAANALPFVGSTRARAAKPHTPGAPVVLQDGLVYLPKFLSPEQQQWLVDETFRVGAGVDGVGGGFYAKVGRCASSTRADRACIQRLKTV